MVLRFRRGKQATEAGRVLSAENLSAIQAAYDNLGAVLAKAINTPSEPETDDEGEDADVEEAFSYNDKRDLIQGAIRSTLGERAYVWVCDLWDNEVAYTVDDDTGSETYKRSYVVADDGSVTLGDASKVIRQTVYTPVAEGADVVIGDVIPLVEASAVAKDGTTRLKIIQPGWGSSGYYSEEMLKADGPKVFTKGLHSYWNHPTATEETDRPERNLSDLAATLTSDAVWEDNGPAGPGLYADAQVFGPYRDAVQELAPHIGVSIRAYGRATEGEADGRRGPVIDQLVAAQSVDFVTVPGAGGQVLQLFESAGRMPAPVVSVQEDPMSEQALQEAQAKIAALEAQVARAEERELLRSARDHAANRLAQSALPDVTRTRLLDQVAANPPIVAESRTLDVAAFDARIDEAVKAELAYIEAIAPSGVIRGMGETTPATEADARTALVTAFVEAGYSEAVAQQMAAR